MVCDTHTDSGADTRLCKRALRSSMLHTLCFSMQLAPGITMGKGMALSYSGHVGSR